MNKIRVTKEFSFEMSHALWDYDGRCKNLHGHSYRMFVTLIGSPLNDTANPKHGMVIDFGDLKRIVNQEIVDKYDHTVVLSSRSDHDKISDIPQMFDRMEIVDFQPTCENLVLFFVGKIKKRLPSHLHLFSLKLHETATSFAEWYASDNE